MHILAELALGPRQQLHLLDRSRPGQQEPRLLGAHDPAKTQYHRLAVGSDLADVARQPEQCQCRRRDIHRAEPDRDRLRDRTRRRRRGGAFRNRARSVSFELRVRLGHAYFRPPAVPVGPSTNTRNGAASVRRMRLVLRPMT